jgi:hypothetical protein
MARYTVHGYCFEHAGTIEDVATNKKEAEEKFIKMKKNILKDLKVGKEGSAMVLLLNAKKQLKKERVEH